jgi:hypothetical protein
LNEAFLLSHYYHNNSLETVFLLTPQERELIKIMLIDEYKKINEAKKAARDNI